MAAALLTIWSSASRLKLTVITSTIGRRPPSAAPIPAPTKADSDSGVSRTSPGPNSSSSPWLTAEAPPEGPRPPPHRPPLGAPALRPELLEQPVADRERAAVAADVLAHQEDALVGRERLAQRRPHRLPVGHGRHRGVVPSARRASTGSQGPGSATATAASISARTAASIP